MIYYETFENIDAKLKIINGVNWNNKTNEEKHQLIQLAMLQIDSYNYVGTKYNIIQENEFPRIFTGTLSAYNGIIPKDIKLALIYQVDYLLTGNNNVNNSNNSNIKSYSQGLISVEFRDDVNTNVLSSYVLSFINKFINSTNVVQLNDDRPYYQIDEYEINNYGVTYYGF